MGAVPGNQTMLREHGMGNYGNYSSDVINTMKRIEQKSQVPMTGISINFNSSFPARVGAVATAAGGNEIHLAPGNSHHYKHELGHIVQQRRGLVHATESINGHKVCTAQSLEEDATRCGEG